MKTLPRKASPPLRKQRIAERPESDATFRLLFASNPMALWVYDLETLRFLDVNDVACHNYGYTRDEFLAMTLRDIRPAEDIAPLNVSVLTTDEQTFNSGIWRHRKKDGTIIRVEILSHEIDYEGRRARFVCPRDVTERLRAEEAREQVAALLREREAALRRAQIMAKLAHVITRSDGSFESWSETLPQLIGLDPRAMPTSIREWLKIVHPDDRAAFRSTAIEAAETGVRKDVEYRLQRPDGTWINILEVIEPLQTEVGPRWSKRWFGTLQDITEQKRAEQRIRRLNRVYAVLSGINALIVRVGTRGELFRDACRIAVEAGQFPLVWIGVVDHEEKRVRPVAWEGVGDDYIQLMPLGIDEGAPETYGLAGRAVTQRTAMVTEDMAIDTRILISTEASRRGFHSLAVLPLLISGKVVAVLALYARETAFFDAEEMKLLLELAGDIAFALDHIAKAEQLDYLALYDPLTELPNRNLFHERLALETAVATREECQLAVVLLDTEHFNTVNDTLGRRIGDELLKQIAKRCATLAGDPALLARLAADQFAVLVRDSRTEDDVARIVEQWNRDIFGTPYDLGETKLTVSAKFGIAVFPGDGMDADTLLRNAGVALKRAKATGERYLFYTQEMTERVAGHLVLENQLRQALENDEFVLYYQPKVDVETRRIVGVEALIRWQSPDLGLVPPLRFIPLLEETGMILEVGAWALRRAVLDHRHWLEKGLAAPRVAVNVSAIQLRQRDFVDIVRETLGNAGSPPPIDIEITESVIMENVESTVQKLRAIRDLGVNIAIDDFGTGYSSLGYLAKLPVHSLKIDRSFIAAMGDEPDAMTLVSTMISLAHSLRLEVCAEGVETEEQAKVLRLLRCDEMQGYLISRPVPEIDLRKMMI